MRALEDLYGRLEDHQNTTSTVRHVPNHKQISYMFDTYKLIIIKAYMLRTSSVVMSMCDSHTHTNRILYHNLGVAIQLSGFSACV